MQSDKPVHILNRSHFLIHSCSFCTRADRGNRFGKQRDISIPNGLVRLHEIDVKDKEQLKAALRSFHKEMSEQKKAILALNGLINQAIQSQNRFFLLRHFLVKRTKRRLKLLLVFYVNFMQSDKPVGYTDVALFTEPISSISPRAERAAVYQEMASVQNVNGLVRLHEIDASVYPLLYTF